MTIDQIILERLDALQMSRGALALQMGVSRQAVYGWCDGSSTPKLRRLPALSRALGVDVADLVSCLLSPTAAVEGADPDPALGWTRGDA